MNALALAEPDFDRRWYVLLCQPQRERTAADALTERLFRVYLPLMTVIRSYAVRTAFGVIRRKHRLPVPIFPGYCFLNFSFTCDAERRDLVEAAPGVRRFLLVNQTFAVISSDAVRAIQDKENELNDRRRKPKLVQQGFSRGERVLITEGPFRDFVATISDIERLDDGQRISLLFDLLGRDTVTTLPVDHIRRL